MTWMEFTRDETRLHNSSRNVLGEDIALLFHPNAPPCGQSWHSVKIERHTAVGSFCRCRCRSRWERIRDPEDKGLTSRWYQKDKSRSFDSLPPPVSQFLWFPADNCSFRINHDIFNKTPIRFCSWSYKLRVSANYVQITGFTSDGQRAG